VTGSAASASAWFITVHHQSTLPATLIATGDDGCNELQLFRGWFKNAGASSPNETLEVPVDPDVVDWQATGIVDSHLVKPGCAAIGFRPSRRLDRAPRDDHTLWTPDGPAQRPNS
jgi:hypothetical protein